MNFVPETVREAELRTRRTIAEEFATRYLELKEREAELSFDVETFYMDVAALLGRFGAESLAARIGVTRDAVYQWAKRGRRVRKERSSNETVNTGE